MEAVTPAKTWRQILAPEDPGSRHGLLNGPLPWRQPSGLRGVAERPGPCRAASAGLRDSRAGFLTICFQAQILKLIHSTQNCGFSGQVIF